MRTGARVGGWVVGCLLQRWKARQQAWTTQSKGSDSGARPGQGRVKGGFGVKGGSRGWDRRDDAPVVRVVVALYLGRPLAGLAGMTFLASCNCLPLNLT